ncbi:hypothetical protein KC850_03135 [Candidatus Kaiserbacteria bacterium]|nr:hypothetical protein [Candidatus Kaiserbacteria bacterium]
MPSEPQIEILSLKRRNRLFFLLLVVFLVALPVMIFYTTGYRLSFENEETSIVTTGGMYITTDNLEVDVYVDQKQIEKPRLFRSAYYIQNIEAGKHRVVVQRPDLQTWVKDLPVDPYIVIEAAAFNMPVVPHIRPVTEFNTIEGLPVFRNVSSTTILLPSATTTIQIYATSSSATSSYSVNEEFIFVKSLFSSTSSSSRSVFEKFLNEVDRFRFATTSSVDNSTTTEELVESGNMRLVEREGEIFAVWKDDANTIPYYFCVSNYNASSTASRYGQHVADAIVKQSLSTTTPLMLDGDRVCRSEIKLNHLRQDVYFYDFFPNDSDLILLQLEDGLYVTEIDDRAWQNTQLLYGGDDFRVVIENNIIYVFEDGKYFEIITEIEPI